MDKNIKYLLELSYGEFVPCSAVTREYAYDIYMKDLKNRNNGVKLGAKFLAKHVVNGWSERVGKTNSIFIFFLFFYLEEHYEIRENRSYSLTEEQAALIAEYLSDTEWSNVVSYEIPDNFFVQIQTDAGEVFNSVKTANEIINRIDMQDCSGEQMAVFMTTAFGKVVPLEVKGCWHDLKNPLLIECVDPYGNVVISGYGTDH